MRGRGQQIEPRRVAEVYLVAEAAHSLDAPNPTHTLARGQRGEGSAPGSACRDDAYLDQILGSRAAAS